MLPLESRRWQELAPVNDHGKAVADWLRRLTRAADTEAAMSVWNDPVEDMPYGKLCHQETVGPLAYAAIPHIVGLAATLGLPEHRDFRRDLLVFAGFAAACALIPTARPVPDDLRASYAEALQEARRLIAETLAHTEDEEDLRQLCSALAGVTENYDLFDHVRHFGDEPICPECGELLVCPECNPPDDDD